jgi:iron-sulfur cluster repair protein YtfE (RIC family)
MTNGDLAAAASELRAFRPARIVGAGTSPILESVHEPGALRPSSDRRHTMARVTQPLHEEHSTLLPRVEALRTTADKVGEVDGATLRRDVSDAFAFLTDALMPHAAAEEQVLYPEIERLMGASEATATMRRDHQEVDQLRQELGALRASFEGSTLTQAQTRDLRRVLYGLYTLLRIHFAKEEEVYLPLLDARLSQDDANALFARMEQAAGAARGHAGHGA